jgi:2-alkenal reductase
MLPKILQRRSVRALAALLIVLVFLIGIGFSGALWGREATAPVAAQGNSAVVAQTTGGDDTLANLYDKVLPAVVNIQVTKAAAPAVELPDLPGLPNNMPDIPNLPQQGEGSGWLYDNEGHIVTNNHVVDGAEKVTVIFSNGMWTKGEVVAADPQADLAVIKVTLPKGVEATPLPLAKSNSMRVGYPVIAIGNPFGLEGTLTTGIVSALGRSFPAGQASGGSYTLPDVIQTDAAINPGNSGGPLLNMAGEVVGVNFAIESPVRANSGVGFAIPVSIVERIVPALIKDGHYSYAYLGISGNTITPDLAEALKLPENVLGAYVEQVMANGPASKAGIKAGTKTVEIDGIKMHVGGDIITAIDGNPVRQFSDLVSFLVTQAEPGKEAKLTVLRDGKSEEIAVTLGERPKEQPQQTTSEGGHVTPRAAVAIARDAVNSEGLLMGEIRSTTVTPDQQDGKPVWVVELSDGDKTATVIVDAQTGEVIDATAQ